MGQRKVMDNPASLTPLPSHLAVGNIMATPVRDVDRTPATSEMGQLQLDVLANAIHHNCDATILPLGGVEALLCHSLADVKWSMYS